MLRDWAVALAEEGHDRRAALEALLAAVDEALAALGAVLDEIDPRSVVVVPHRLLHLVPFDAVTPFVSRPLLVAPSVELLAAARRRRRRGAAGRSVTVANPTLDLPASLSEAAAVAQRLPGGVQLRGAASTRPAVAEALSGAVDVFHFCGHGSSDLLEPDRSALQLCPEPGVGDPFAGAEAEVEETADGELRTVVDAQGRTFTAASATGSSWGSRSCGRRAT